MRNREDYVVVGTGEHALLGEREPAKGAKKRALGTRAMPTGVHAENIVMAFRAILAVNSKRYGVTETEKSCRMECVVRNTVRSLEIGKVFDEYFPDGDLRI